MFELICLTFLEPQMSFSAALTGYFTKWIGLKFNIILPVFFHADLIGDLTAKIS